MTEVAPGDDKGTDKAPFWVILYRDARKKDDYDPRPWKVFRYHTDLPTDEDLHIIATMRDDVGDLAIAEVTHVYEIIRDIEVREVERA